MKRSKIVVKPLEITTRKPCPDRLVEYHIEPLAGNNRCDDGRDEWYLIKDENAEDYVLIIIDYHLFEENEIEVKHFDTLLSACNYIRDELDRDFSLGDSETADAIVGLLDAIFGDKE